MIHISRLNNKLHAVNTPAILTPSGELWYLNGKLHRGNGKPAVKMGSTIFYFYRGIEITEEMAKGELAPLAILGIKNMEQRQASMEIVGYEKFFSYAKLLDKFTPDCFLNRFPVDINPMYSLYSLNTGQNEENEIIKILMMCDPSKSPIIKYFIRVKPDEISCKLAVAHSYNFASWDDFFENKEWV